MLANFEYYITQPYIVVDINDNVIKRFDTLNAKAQCEQYARWKIGTYCYKKGSK